MPSAVSLPVTRRSGSESFWRASSKREGRMLERGPARKISVYVGEDIRHHGEPLYLAVLNYLFRQRVSGAMVTKGIAGFGADHHLHTTRILEVSENLPIKIEFIES